MDFASWTGLLGGIAGTVALLVEAWEMWKRRKPALRLFVPLAWTGTIQSAEQQRMLALLIRISNSSEMPAHPYFENIRADVRYRGEWHHCGVTDMQGDEKVGTSFPQAIERYLGIGRIPYFCRFDDVAITVGGPYSRFLLLTSDEPGVYAEPECARLTLLDCTGTSYTLEAKIGRVSVPQVLP